MVTCEGRALQGKVTLNIEVLIRSFPFRILSAMTPRCPADDNASVSSSLETSQPNGPIIPTEVV
jgi:hypothetical protein